MRLISKPKEDAEPLFRELTIRATGNAIVKALILIEIVKRRVGDLHQINEITSAEIVDVLKA